MAQIFAGKTAVVTGGTTGIGHATALSLARAGAHVVVGSRSLRARPDSYDERSDLTIVELIESEGGSAEFVKTDVASAAEVSALAKRAIAHNGRLDIWINNAGVVCEQKRLHEYEDAELDACLDVNTKGVWNGMRAAIRQMLNQPEGGVIVNVISTAGIRPHARQAPYDISKAAASQATQCAALEYGPNKIRINGVCPTVVRTSISRPFVDAPEFRAWLKSVVTLGAPVDQQQVADAVMFLASDAASAITGVLLPVDMGEQLGPIDLGLKQD